MSMHFHMNFMQRVRLALVALVAFAALLAAPVSAHAAEDYGYLCGYFESSNNCGAAEQGVAYGTYQMSASNAYKMLAWAETKYPDDKEVQTIVAKLFDAYETDGGYCGKTFTTKWAKMATKHPDAFQKMQYNYVKKCFYKEAVKAWQAEEPEFVAANFTEALQNVIWSTAVQHGVTGSKNIFVQAMDALGGYDTAYSEQTLIEAIYAERARLTTKSELKQLVSSSATIVEITTSALQGYTYSQQIASSYDLYGKCLAHFYSCSAAVQVGVFNRLGVKELALALEMLEAAGVDLCDHVHTKGGKQTLSTKSDSTHYVKSTKVMCKDCGTLVSPAGKTVAKHKFNANKKKTKCKCGAKKVVHSKGVYKTKDALNLRASASASGAILTSVAKGKKVTATKIKTDSAGNYWALVTVNGYTGYLRITYLKKK